MRGQRSHVQNWCILAISTVQGIYEICELVQKVSSGSNFILFFYSNQIILLRIERAISS